MDVPSLISWKFKDTPGMTTRNGQITEFPISTTDRNGNHIPVLDRDGVERTSLLMPTQQEIDQWTAEYTAWLAEQPAPKTPQEEIAELKAQILALKSGVNDTRTKVALAPIDFSAVEAEATVEIKPK